MTPIKKRSEGHTKKFRQQKRCASFIVEKIIKIQFYVNLKNDSFLKFSKN